jgi:DNA-binding Xre family transcriptional regulator
VKTLTQGRGTQRNILTYGRIVSKLTEVACKKGLCIETGKHAGKANIQKLHRLSGISTATLWYLLRRPSTFIAMDFHTLAKLCFALDAQPGDLFKYERFPQPGGISIGEAKHPQLDDLPGVE